jgi:hypothetical protein
MLIAAPNDEGPLVIATRGPSSFGAAINIAEETVSMKPSVVARVA